MEFNHEWQPDQCHTVLDKYHNCCIAKLHKGRPRGRGNPPNVIHAAVCLKNMWQSGKVCEVCSHTKWIQLHHVDGQWWNYQLENLQFLCSTCHLAAHGGCWKHLKNGVVPMAWTPENIKTMNDTVTEVCRSKFNRTVQEAVEGKMMAAVFRVVEENAESLFGRQTGAASLYDAWKRHNSVPASRTVRIESSPYATQTTQRTVSVDDAIRIGRTIEVFEKFGITLSFNSYGV